MGGEPAVPDSGGFGKNFNDSRTNESGWVYNHSNSG